MKRLPSHRVFLDNICVISANSCWSIPGKINANQWHHLAFVLSGETGFVYLNGTQVYFANLFAARNVATTSNYIGGSKSGSLNGILDDLKMFDDAFTPDDVFRDYNVSLSNKILLYFSFSLIL